MARQADGVSYARLPVGVVMADAPLDAQPVVVGLARVRGGVRVGVGVGVRVRVRVKG